MVIDEKLDSRYPWVKYWSDKFIVDLITREVDNLVNTEMTKDNPLYDRFVHYAQVLQQPDVNSVFDLGCAVGHILSFLKRIAPDKDYYGGDISTELLQQGLSFFPDINFIQCDGLNIGIKDKAFDFVISEDIQCIVLGYKKLIQELCRITGKYLSICLRIRGNGKTVTEVEKSHQVSPDGKTKVPYITMNYREFINIVDEIVPQASLFYAWANVIPLSDSIHIEGYGRQTMAVLFIIDMSGETQLFEGEKLGFREQTQRAFDFWKQKGVWA